MFKKYGSIEDIRFKKEINNFLNNNPEANNIFWVIQEKIHGSNFSIYFNNINGDIEVKYASRLHILGDHEHHYNYKSILKHDDIVDLINKIKRYMKEYNKNNIIIYGELFGKSIQNGIFYCDDIRFLIFDMVIDNQWLTFEELFQLLDKKLNLSSLLVPIIGTVFGLDKALNVNTEFNSKVSNHKNNLCEGVVIKPLDKIFYSNGHPFYIKKKNLKFLEIKNTRQKVPKVFDDNVLLLKEKFKDYVNENRLNSAFSKYGIIEDRKDIGKYIKIIYDDCLEDFLKDYDLNDIPEKDKKYILNINHCIAQLLLEKL